MIDQYFRAWSNTLLATQVMTARLPILYLSMFDPNASSQREVTRMFAEKQQALLEGLAAVQHIVCDNVHDMLNNTGRGPAHALDYIDALTAPAERILKANAERLTGTR